MRTKKYQENFVGSKLAGRDLSSTDYIECDFRGVKLTGTNLANNNHYGSNFEGADLYNAVISLNCFTFSDIKLDTKQVHMMLYLLQLADIDPAMKAQIQDLVGLDRIEQIEKVFQRTKK